ncbi:MAG: tetratricopeptide repeat protein, partial [Campylobacterales bacterium]|nr:tetratricopeptide repeat protein [Campylobacterales bacterium]
NNINNSVINIVKETLGQNAQNEIISNISTKIVAYLQEDKKELVVMNKELRTQIQILTQKVSFSTTIDEILNEERTKRKALEKELNELKAKLKDNPTLQNIIDRATKALDNFEYQKYHEILDSYSDDKELAQIKYLKAKEYYNRLLYQEAKKQMHKAVVLDESNQHYNHEYASILDDLGEYDDALKYYQTSLTLQQKATPNPTNNTASTYNNIGSVYQAKGEYDKALEYHQKALAIKEKVLGVEHPSTATSYNNIGEVYRAKGEYDKALEYYQKTSNIFEKVLGGEHPSTATSYNNIAGVYYAKGEYDKALEYYQKALAIREKVLGLEHPDTATSYNNIAWLYYEMQNYQEAAKMMQKAVDIREKVLPANHHYIIESKRDLETIKAKL